MNKVLQDLGEREIVRSLLPEFCEAVGDDCAIVSLGDRDLVVTTDPVPQPAARLLGNDPDLYWMGWLLVTINASDLAAAGAAPVCFLAAIEAPSDLSIEAFRRMLAGVRDACQEEGLVYVGGNLREAKDLAAVGTAIGTTSHGCALRRVGAKAGNIVVSIGRGGVFWHDVMEIRKGRTIRDRDSSPLFKPRSQLKAMRELADRRLICAAIDNSDGILPSLVQLASASGVDIQLDLGKLTAPEAEDKADLDPARLWLGWGDWNVLAAMHPDHLPLAKEIVEQAGSSLFPIGDITGEGTGRLTLTRNGIIKDAPRVESERFAKDSWFSGGIENYLKIMLNADLP